MKFATKLNLRRFDTEEGMTRDLAPAISIDHTDRLIQNVNELMTLLGIEEMTSMNEGSSIKIYKMTLPDGLAEQVGPGEKIKLTEVKRVLSRTIDLSLKKYRKAVPAEDIQKFGKDTAINKTDKKLLREVQSKIKNDLFVSLQEADGSEGLDPELTLQAALASIWGAAQTFYEDNAVEMIYFVNSDDIADYLKSAQITTQTLFGFAYIEDFLGLGTVVISPRVTKGHPFGTAKENMNGAFVPIGGDLMTMFGLTVDETGLVGMVHNPVGDHATIETLLYSDVVFYAEDESGIFVGEIGEVTP